MTKAHTAATQYFDAYKARKPPYPYGGHYIHIQLWAFCFSFSPVGAIIRRSPALCRNISGYFFYATPSYISFIGVSLAFYFLLKYLSAFLGIISHVPPFFHNPYRLPVGNNYVYVGVSPFLSVLLLEVTRFIRIPPSFYFRDCRSAVTLSEYNPKTPSSF